MSNYYEKMDRLRAQLNSGRKRVNPTYAHPFARTKKGALKPTQLAKGYYLNLRAGGAEPLFSRYEKAHELRWFYNRYVKDGRSVDMLGYWPGVPCKFERVKGRGKLEYTAPFACRFECVEVVDVACQFLAKVHGCKVVARAWYAYRGRVVAYRYVWGNKGADGLVAGRRRKARWLFVRFPLFALEVMGRQYIGYGEREMVEDLL